MDPDALAAFALATLVLMSAPGPSQLLIASNSLACGFRRSLATAAGDLSANALQIAAAALGFAALLSESPGALDAARWGGAALGLASPFFLAAAAAAAGSFSSGK